MRKLLTLLFTISSLTVATTGQAADGIVDITWGTTCTPIVIDITPTAAPLSLIASEIGNDQNHTGYQVRFLIAAADRTVPDAWRFDAAGCQGVAFIQLNHLPPATAAKTCPAFQQGASSVQIKDYSFSPVTYPSTEIRAVIANTYPAGVTANPATRYFLAQALFDHTFSVTGAGTPGETCGGLEVPMCVALLTGLREGGEGTTSYLRMADNVEVPFLPGNTFLTTNGSAGCPATPVENKTWGQVKSQYRN